MDLPAEDCELISTLIQELAAEPSAEAVGRRGLRYLLEAGGASAGALFLPDEPQGESRLVASYGVPLNLLRELGQSKAASSAPTCPGLTATVSIPLTLAARAMGTVVLFAPSPGDLSQTSYADFRALCDVLALMLEKVRLAAERDRLRQAIQPPRLETDQMAALLKIARRLGKSLKLEAVLKTVLQESTSSLNAGAGVLYLNQGDHLARAAAHGSEESLRPAEELAIRAVSSGGPVVELVEGQAVVGVPLATEEKHVGALVCVREGAEAFSVEDTTFLWTLAGHAATAIENARLHEETEERSVRDALTGLYNVRQLDARLTEEVRRAERYDSELSFIMLDIDHFKRYNDTYGHLQGDRVLRRVADAIRQSVRTPDQVFRYGGEELCVILPETPPLEAWLVAERIRISVAASSAFTEEHSQESERLSVSIGVASFPQDAATPRDLVAQADAALYRAKAQGRNCVVTAWGTLPDAQEKTVTTSLSDRRGR